MQCLVVSDTHGQTAPITRVVRAHPAAELVLHLGDSERTREEVAAACDGRALVMVAGNCDRLTDVEETCTLTLCGVRILLLHGHRYRGMSLSTAVLMAAARDTGAQVILHGHTHMVSEMTLTLPDGREVLVANPGSLCRPRDGAGSFGSLALEAGAARFVSLRL